MFYRRIKRNVLPKPTLALRSPKGVVRPGRWRFWEDIPFTVVLKVLQVINNMQSRIYIIKWHDMYACSDFFYLF